MISKSKSLIRKLGASLFPMLYADPVFNAAPKVSLLKPEHTRAGVSMLLNNYRQKAESKMRKERWS